MNTDASSIENNHRPQLDHEKYLEQQRLKFVLKDLEVKPINIDRRKRDFDYMLVQNQGDVYDFILDRKCLGQKNLEIINNGG